MIFSKNNKIILGLIILLLAILGTVRLFTGEDKWICQNDQWVKHGRPSAPKPLTGCGPETSQTEDKDEATENPDIKNLNVKPGDVISSPLVLTGEARGWYFEGSFPVFLVNWNGLIIAEGIAQAKGDWMTSSFVPFEAILTFTKPDYKDNGALILKKDNPSGLPEHDDALEFSIIFK